MSSKKGNTDYKFPDTLEEFGYGFNKDGQLRHLKTDEPFQFQVKEDDLEYNQKHYEVIGDIITEKVYSMMEEDCDLQKIYLPQDVKEGEPQTFFFMSKDAMAAKRLMILIHGSGAVRAGQWARKLIINDCLDSGTQLPFIKWAQSHEFRVIVANPNLNRAKVDRTFIRENSSPEEHVETLWTKFVARSKAEHIVIVAHSFGGVCTLELAKNHIDEFIERVMAIALTDSVHSFTHQKSNEKVIKFYQERGRNWASASEHDPLDSPLESKMDFCPTVSAGTDRHDYTSYSSMKSIFKFIEERFKESRSKLDIKNNVTSEEANKNEEDTVNTEQEDGSNTQEMLSQSQETESEAMSQESKPETLDVEMDSQQPKSPKSEL